MTASSTKLASCAACFATTSGTASADTALGGAVTGTVTSARAEVAAGGDATAAAVSRCAEAAAGGAAGAACESRTATACSTDSGGITVGGNIVGAPCVKVAAGGGVAAASTGASCAARTAADCSIWSATAAGGTKAMSSTAGVVAGTVTVTGAFSGVSCDSSRVAGSASGAGVFVETGRTTCSGETSGTTFRWSRTRMCAPNHHCVVGLVEHEGARIQQREFDGTWGGCRNGEAVNTPQRSVHFLRFC